MTLRQRRDLLTLGGWLSLHAAARLAGHAEHPEIAAWCLETRAWEVLTGGDNPAAVRLSQRAQAIAPLRSSAYIQAVAQEGRAWARMGQRAQTREGARTGPPARGRHAAP